MTATTPARPVAHRSSRWRDRIILLVVLAAGGALTWLAGSSLEQTEALRVKERKTAAIQAVVGAFNLELTRTTEAVRNAGLMLESNPQLTRGQFNRYMQKMVENHLSVDLMEWQPIVPANRLAQFEMAARKADRPGFRVLQPDASGTGWEPVHGRDEYVPILFAWPEKYRTEGLDMSFSQERMASKLQSRAIAQPVASETFEVMKEGRVKSGTTGIAISTAVFDPDQTAIGYLAAVVDLSTLFEKATRLADAAKFDLLVFSSAAPEAAPIYVFLGDDSDLRQVTTGLRLATADDQGATVDFARQAWKLVLHPRPAFHAQLHTAGSRLAFAVGLGMTLLIVAALYQLQINRRKIERAESTAGTALLALERQRLLLQEALRIGHMGSWQMDAATNRVVWSEELYRMQGLNPALPPPDFAATAKLFTPESWERLNSAMSRTLEAGVPYELELEMVKPDGSHGWMLARGEAVKDAHDAIVGMQGVATDITERKRSEAVRAQLEAQLRESQKMEAIGTLAGGIAHDFNNVLATILGNTELARQDSANNPPALQSLDEIRKAATRARDLVQPILSFSRRQPTTRKWIDLGPLVLEATRLLRATLPARLKIDVDCAPDLPPVFADATQMQQVLINLANNAVQAMASGPGQIGIRLDAVMLDAALAGTDPVLLELKSRSPGRMLRLAVSDSGSGMDEATRQRIFEPFFTTKAVNEGTGLGLSVVHGIVQAHHGAITVASASGKGSTFTVYLPASGETQAGADASAGDAVPPLPEVRDARGELHLLYIDDDDSLVLLVKRLLERQGYRVSGYADQRAALAALRADPAGFDLVLTDYNMPGLSGLEVAGEVRALRADLPVAITSGFIDETLRAGAADAGVFELIPKAASVQAFCEAIKRLAERVQKKTS